MSKYNLYNLSQAKPVYTIPRTFFQQKWTAKSLARGYHGEQVRESKWEKMFSRRFRGVVPMTARYLASTDGSFQSAGRGAGFERFNNKPNNRTIPYMQMTFAPLERRLDVAVFRALFASSTRQARQFVIHGAVTVNGKKVLGDLSFYDLSLQPANSVCLFADETSRVPPQPRRYVSSRH